MRMTTAGRQLDTAGQLAIPAHVLILGQTSCGKPVVRSLHELTNSYLKAHDRAWACGRDLALAGMYATLCSIWDLAQSCGN